MRTVHIAFLTLLFTSSAACVAMAGNEYSSGIADVRQSFDLQVPQTPSLVLVGGEHRLMYEIHLTSFARNPLTVTGLDVLDASSGKVLGRLNGAQLDATLDIPGLAAGATSRRMIETGRRGIIYVDLSIVGRAPASLRHRVTFEAGGPAESERATLLGGLTAVNTQSLPVLGPPLRGGPWVAVYDPSLARGHRRVVYAVGGKATIPGRYAIDWMRPNTKGGAGAIADPSRGAGAEVLAVADGVIASTRDGVPEPRPGEKRPQVGLSDATGNYIALEISRGRYAFYEHLMPGLLVKSGDRVRRGQVIGRLGSTGQASRPHLHFHLADANSPLAAEGLPYLLTGRRVVGAYQSIAAFEAGEPWRPVQSQGDVAALPAPNVVMKFPAYQRRSASD